MPVIRKARYGIPRALVGLDIGGADHLRIGSTLEKPNRITAIDFFAIDFRKSINNGDRPASFGIADVERIVTAKYYSVSAHRLDQKAIAVGARLSVHVSK